MNAVNNSFPAQCRETEQNLKDGRLYGANFLSSVSDLKEEKRATPDFFILRLLLLFLLVARDLTACLLLYFRVGKRSSEI